MISEIYREYFQKSYTFLYPLLGFHKTRHPKPEQTYLTWEGVYSFHDRKLICVYEKEETEEWRNFERDHLITHKFLDHCEPLSDNTIAYVFDLNSIAEDYDHFMAGKYSKMSNASKKILTDYYGVHTPEWVYVESFLFPDKYYKQYAQILDVEEDLLKEVGELCELHDTQKETFSTPVSNVTLTPNL